MEVKDIIRQRRLELGLTMEQVGNYVGVSKSTVKKWESGYIANMRRDRIALLAQILEVSPTDLLSTDDSSEPGEESPIQDLSGNPKDERLHEINQIYRDLNNKGQEQMLDYAHYLQKEEKYRAAPPESGEEPAI